MLHWTDSLPKPRSGKIMRRILRKIAAGDTSNLGDTSTLADPGVVGTARREAGHRDAIITSTVNRPMARSLSGRQILSPTPPLPEGKPSPKGFRVAGRRQASTSPASIVHYVMGVASAGANAPAA
ncbi:hypothetical protein ACNKHK_26555 [Shigella flexneri]